jgi:penicillin-binding protein 2
VTEDSLGALISQAWLLCGISPDVLSEQIFNTPAQYPIPLCEASEQESERIRSIYPAGLEWTTYNSRFYFQQGAGSNIVGYTQQVPVEELEEYRRLGYAGDERVGRDGIELWAEDYLSGVHGGELYVINPTTGAIVTKVGESAPKPADSVYLTIDRNLQFYAEEAIEGFTGAVVVLERDTGRVLAMATSPDYDSMFSHE